MPCVATEATDSLPTSYSPDLIGPKPHAIVPNQNPQTQVIYDLLGPRTPHPLHVGTPNKRMLQEFAQRMAESTLKRINWEANADDCLGGICQYGYPLGEQQFMDALVGFLSREYGESVDRKYIAQTAGVTATFPFILSQLFAERPIIYVETITYFRTMAILNAFRYESRPIRTTFEGIDLDDLEATWERDIGSRRRDDGNYNAVLNVVPQFQNPLGTCLTEAQSRRLVKLARKFHVLVICDDVYNFYYYFDEKSPKRLFACDDPTDADYGGGHVISLGSFSKIFSPSLRLGWVEAPSHVLEKCFSRGAVTCSGGSMNSWTGGMIAPFLSSEAAHQHVAINRQLAKNNLIAALEVLDAELPPQCSVPVRPRGGYFIFVQLPIEIHSTEAALRLKERRGIALNDMRTAWTGGDSHPEAWQSNALRIAFTFVEEPHLRVAVSEFCAELREMCREAGFDVGAKRLNG